MIYDYSELGQIKLAQRGKAEPKLILMLTAYLRDNLQAKAIAEAIASEATDGGSEIPVYRSSVPLGIRGVFIPVSIPGEFLSVVNTSMEKYCG